MDISRQFIDNPIRVWLTVLLLGVGGIFALLNIGRLEDPAFTIKTAVVVTHYPGASAQQVEEEVTLPLENALQQLPYLDNVSSISSNGLSQITVNIASRYHSNELPQIWDELRRRVGDASRQFPPGVVTPFVNDDFGDVFGFFFAISGDNFTNPELSQYADQLRRELVLIPGVGKVAIGGAVPQQINVDINLAKMAARGVTLGQISTLLGRVNSVANAGEIASGSESIRLHPTGEFENLDELGDLIITPPGVGAATRLRDIATISRGLTVSPSSIYHANGRQAVTMGVSFIPGVNVIDVGRALEAKLQQMSAEKPAGINIDLFYDQAAEVGHSVNGFIINFLMALAIVIGVLLIFMGLRSGIIIALSLALNVLGTLLIMYLWGIELQRISLGALIIALSMLVDNAIVIVEGVLIARQRGSTLMTAINYVIRRSALPLLGATVIAILAFAPIGLSQDSTGEYCKSLFQVLLISLLLSWFSALTLTPVMIKWWLFKGQQTADTPAEVDPYNRRFYRLYQNMLNALLVRKTITLALMAVLLAGAIWGFGAVRQNFFPSSNTPIFFVDLWLPYGTDIVQTERITSEIEKSINGQPGVVTTVSTIGQGSMRFILTYSGQRQYSNYAQIMVRMDDQRNIAPLTRHVDEDIARHYPEINASTKRVMFGPSGDSAIEVRIKGPDPDRLRLIASQVDDILARDPATDSVRNDWQNRSKVIRPQYVAASGRELGVDKQDIDSALEMNFSGSRVGLYREGSDLLPVVVRPPESERQDANHLNNVLVWSQNRQQYIPLSNVVSGFALEWEDPLILRRDRSRVLTVQTDPDPLSNETSGDILARVKPEIDALPLPHGYSIEWGGDAENSSEAQQGIFTTLPIGFLVMFIITILMFSSVKNAVAIWLTVPLALIGVTPGFLLTGIPFGFMALIGLLSLSGMLIRNGIVLVEEIEQQKEHKAQHQAIVDAATSRLRPILLTAFTTVLGLAPLLRDVFFQSMAVVIMFGLGFATILTLLVLPVIYACFHPTERAEPQ
ncbi:efflux RND transporter permease subunit [Lelliottia wanjuensis]|uniref:Efflux RND transporter permease subunit n=1 Tax=Lelliottia wanjuensis TaxID=3050585 RepID=A0AAP4D184_9ENTR|nr:MULTISPECIES: efflux RND transporter permease subunit [unclassified Lelliottia]MDK9363286.1 efflux RND transporter permease subunit [Lelliottia sp. V106_12]MDK9585652.1 efflux RND transporter permease subunit [Lelliottia sp. V86_10]MDK9616928.1 efflux RND transporter permease subunit [Lelliottia sp. V106_9]